MGEPETASISASRGAGRLARAARPVMDRLEGRVLFATQPVNSLTLINAQSDQPVSGFVSLDSGDVLNLSTLPSRKLNIRANVEQGLAMSALDAANAMRRHTELYRDFLAFMAGYDALICPAMVSSSPLIRGS